MKFLILTQFFPPEKGAAQTRLAELTKQLVKDGHNVEVITALPNYPTGQIFPEYRGQFYKKENFEGAIVHYLWLFPSKGKSIMRLLSYLSYMFSAFFGLFLCKKPDYIFVNSGPLFLAIPARILSLIWRKPIIFNVADLWPRSVQQLNATGAGYLLKMALFLERWSYNNAKYITAVTEGIYQILENEKSIPRSKLMFMPNGVNTQIFSADKQNEKQKRLKSELNLNDKLVFIYPGNHGFAHALDNVLEAAKLVQNASKDNPILNKIHILFVGDGSDKERLINLKNKLNLKNVTFHNAVPQETLPDFLQISDVGLINIRNTHLAQETRPAKMFPIMAMKKPILFAGFGEGAEIIKSINGGVIIEPEKPESLKNAMIDFLTGKFDMVQMGNNNHDYIRKNFEFSQIVKSWLDDLKAKENLI